MRPLVSRYSLLSLRTHKFLPCHHHNANIIRKEQEKHLQNLTQQLAALQERMYSIRFDDSVPHDTKILELRVRNKEPFNGLY